MIGFYPIFKLVMNIKVYFFILVISALTSCEKEVYLNFNQNEKMVLNCILNTDSTITARLSLSRGIEANYEFQAIENATILLYKEKELLGEFTSGNNGKYSLNVKPIPNQTYHIQVLHPDYSDLTATTRVPLPPTIGYHYEIIDYRQNGSVFRIDATFDIYDLKDVENFYWLKPFENNAPFIDSFNRSLDTDSQYGFIYNYFMRISDEAYDGEILSLSTVAIKGKTRIFWATDSHYDKYLKSSLKDQLNKESGLPFKEPVQIYSNIQNGYGIFGSCATTTIEQ